MTKKLKIQELSNPDNESFAGVPLNEEGDIAIIDLRSMKQIAEDVKERIKEELLNLRKAPHLTIAIRISDRIGDMKRKFGEYLESKNN